MVVGLLVSWYADTAASATIAAVAVAAFFVVLLFRPSRRAAEVPSLPGVVVSRRRYR